MKVIHDDVSHANFPTASAQYVRGIKFRVAADF